MSAERVSALPEEVVGAVRQVSPNWSDSQNESPQESPREALRWSKRKKNHLIIYNLKKLYCISSDFYPGSNYLLWVSQKNIASLKVKKT